MSVTSLWGQVKIAAASGVLFGGYPYARNVLFVGDNTPEFGTEYATIALAIAAMVDGDILMLGPQRYNEAGLIIPQGLDNITILGMSNPDSTYIESSTAGAEGLQVLGENVTLVNIGLGAPVGGDYGLKVGSDTVTPSRFTALGCKIYGPTGANPAAACVLQGAIDAWFEDCVFTTCSNAVLFDDATGSLFVLRATFLNNIFQKYTTVGLGIASGGEVRGLKVLDNTFCNQEDGSAPTDYILLSSNNHTGIISGNRFASATNAAATITIGTGLIYPTNFTEAGPSTARPA